MNALSLDDRLLVLRHLAALRARGWPAGRALLVVASALPVGRLRDEIERMADALGRGEEIRASDDPLLQLLARGESAGPEVLSEAIAAYGLQRVGEEAVSPGRHLVLMAGLGVAFAGVGAFVAERFVANHLDTLGVALPPITRVLLEQGPVGAVLSVAVFAGCLLAAWRPPGWLRRLTGGESLDRAGQLRLVTAAIASGLPERVALSWVSRPAPETVLDLPPLRSEPMLRQAASLLASHEGGAAAARVCAEELEARGRSRRTFVRLGGPPVVLFVSGAAIGLVLTSFYQPLFSMAAWMTQ